MYEQILQCRLMFSLVGCLALEVKLLMVPFKNAQDKESTVLVLSSANTPPKLNILPLQMDRTVRNCTVKGCTLDVKTGVTVKPRLANNV